MRANGLLTLALAALLGCATGSPARNPHDDIVLRFPSQKPEKPGRIDADTRSLELRVQMSKLGGMPVRQPIELNEYFVPKPRARLDASFPGLPIDLEVENVADNFWEIEIPANLLQLLAKETRRVTYRGSLLLDVAGTSIPFSLTLTPAPPAPRVQQAGRSAG
jgi:hypothetical protein